MVKVILPGLLLLFGLGCHKAQKTADENPAIWQKIKIDFRRLDENGLTGPDGGKVSVHYEFCIPRAEKNWEEVHSIDHTAVKYDTGSGRAGCDKTQWLIIGDTRQRNYKRVLYNLAALPYVNLIEETFWE